MQLNPYIKVVCLAAISFLNSPATVAADQCVVGYGKFNDNLNNNQLDSYFRINARVTDSGVATGSIRFAGYINHSGGRNKLAGHAMSFCSRDINQLNIVGPYAGYGVNVNAPNYAVICESTDGVPDLSNLSVTNCSLPKYVNTATLFSSGSNVKDTGTAPEGNLGFDDFNIAVVYGANQFATSNGFIRNGTGFLYVGDCELAPVPLPETIMIACP